MAVVYQNNFTSDNGRNVSQSIWGDFPSARTLMEDPPKAFHFFDDFYYPYDEDASDTFYHKYIDTSNTIRGLATSTTVYGGVVRLLTDATDNDGPVLHYRGGPTASVGSCPIIIGNTVGAAFKTYYECRFKKSSITDNQCAIFLGLGHMTTMAADNGLLTDDTGDIVDSVSAIGFRVLHDNGEELDFAWQDSAQTAPVELANIATLVADTWTKVGFVYDPLEVDARKIKLFVNGVPYTGAYVTTTQMDAATFPENDALTPVFGSKNGEATATNFDIDWVRVGQIYY